MITLLAIAFLAPTRVVEVVEPNARNVSIQALVKMPNLGAKDMAKHDIVVQAIPKQTEVYSRREMLMVTSGDPVRANITPDHIRLCRRRRAGECEGGSQPDGVARKGGDAHSREPGSGRSRIDDSRLLERCPQTEYSSCGQALPRRGPATLSSRFSTGANPASSRGKHRPKSSTRPLGEPHGSLEPRSRAKRLL